MSEKDLRGSPDRFGYEWASYSEILPESKRQLERWLGATGLASFKGKRVMDVGCGMGRNPYWFIDAGAASVLAVDVDDSSLGAARKNLAPFTNAKVEKRPRAPSLDGRPLRSRDVHRRAAPSR
jgi:SAM-dependent methyltransferase